MTTTQLLRQPEAAGISAIDHPALQFKREAGIITRRHMQSSPSVKLLTSELRRLALRQEVN
jgi:hypothetical protein